MSENVDFEAEVTVMVLVRARVTLGRAAPHAPRGPDSPAYADSGEPGSVELNELAPCGDPGPCARCDGTTRETIAILPLGSKRPSEAALVRSLALGTCGRCTPLAWLAALSPESREHVEAQASTHAEAAAEARERDGGQS